LDLTGLEPQRAATLLDDHPSIDAVAYLSARNLPQAVLAGLARRSRRVLLSLRGYCGPVRAIEALAKALPGRIAYLDLAFGAVDDRTLAVLAGLQGLEGLNLSLTKVSDTGLVHLAKLSNLGVLVLRGTKVSMRAIDRFKSSPPQCWVGR